MNIESLKQSVKAAMPDAPESAHDFYMTLIEKIIPKQESFTQTFEGRGEANYTMVYHPRRIRLDYEDGKLVIAPHLETGLLYMRGTDGSIATEAIRNNFGLPLREKTMSENVTGMFDRYQKGKVSEVGMRFMAHGIARHQFGNTHNIQMRHEKGNADKAVPEPFLADKGFGVELIDKIDEASGLSHHDSADSLAASLYLKSLFDVDSDMSTTEKDAHRHASAKQYDTRGLFSPKTLSAINGNTEENVALYQCQLQLFHDIRDLVTESYLKGAHSQFQFAETSLQAAASLYPSDNPINTQFDSFAMTNYPKAMINFIITGRGDTPEETRKVMAHRKLFLEAMAQEANIDWFDEIEQGHKSDRMSEFLSKLRSVVDENRLGTFAVNQIMAHIDSGKIPRNLIAQQFGVDYISKKHFRQALQHTGESMAQALALAKLPDNWFEAVNHNTDTAIDIRHTSPYETMRIVTDEYGQHNHVSLNALGYNKIKPYLIRTGKELGRLDGQLHQAAQSDNPEHAEAVKLKVNKEKKIISTQYAWLSKKPDAVDAIIKLDEDYKINASLGDYERTMKLFLDALIKRAAYDIDGADALAVDDYGRIDIDSEQVSRKLMQEMEEAELEYRRELDSDHRDYDDEELFIDEVKVDEFDSLFDQCWSIKSAAENNDRLHKAMSNISKTLGGYSTNNVEWKGLIDAPVDIDGYRFIPITDRKRLLQEGAVQNHCVYTLLNPCLMGETSVFTIEDTQGNVVATMEVQQENGYDGMTHERIQLYGQNNSFVSRDIQRAADTLIEQLDDGTLAPICLAEENDMSDILDNDNIEELADLQLVPFLTDAIYDAYGVARDHLPMGITFSSLIENTEGIYQLFHYSESGQAIQAMDRLSTIYNLDTKTTVTLGKTAPVRDIMDSYHKLHSGAHEATFAKAQARNIHQLINDPSVLDMMTTHAKTYEDEDNGYLPLWSYIEDNVNGYPDGMCEDTFRRCLRSVIDAGCAEQGMQNFASTLMQEANDKAHDAQRHYDLMISNLPEYLSPEPLMQTFSSETKARIQQLGIGEPICEMPRDNERSLGY